MSVISQKKKRLSIKELYGRLCYVMKQIIPDFKFIHLGPFDIKQQSPIYGTD